MKLSFNKTYILGMGILALNNGMPNYAMAQLVDFPVVAIPAAEVESYTPREPTQDELKRYILNADIDAFWQAIFVDVENGSLRQRLAKKYLLLGSGDLAEKELKRAAALGVDPRSLLVDLGSAFLLQKKYDYIFNEILLENADQQDFGDLYLLFGRAYFADGNYEQAFLNLFKAEQLLGDSFELNALMARLYEMMGEYEKAEAYASKALSYDKKNADILILKGELAHRRGGIEQSFRYFERAAFYKPDDVDVLSKLAAGFFDLHRNEEAMVVLRKALARDSRHPFANYMIATLFAEGNNVKTALRYLNAAGSNAYNNSIPALLLQGKLCYATNDFQRAETVLTKLILIDENHMEGRRILGAALLQQGKSNDAITTLKYIAEQNRLDGVGAVLLGSAYIMNGDNDNGSLYLDQAMSNNLGQISPAEKAVKDAFDRKENFGITLNVNSLINKGTSADQPLILLSYHALKEKNYNKAFEYAASIVEQNRTSPIGYNLLGLSYLGQGKVDEARSNFSRAVGIDKHYHAARINLAKIDFINGDPNAGVSHLDFILAANKSYIPAYELLFDEALYNNEPTRAERYLITAISTNPTNLTVWEKLANFYLSNDNVIKAKNTGERMVNIFPDHSVSYKMLGMATLAAGDVAVAIENLKLAIAKDNRDQQAYLYLSDGLIKMGQYDQARAVLKSGLDKVKENYPLMIKLIDIAKKDRNYANGYLYVEQLKLEEHKKAVALIYQGELNLLERRFEDAIKSFESAINAGASTDDTSAGLSEAYARMGPQISPNPILER